MFAKSILAATVAGLAVAAPAPRDDPHYTLLSVHSGNEAVHQKTINFNNNTWVIGLDTTAYTPGPDYASYQNTTSVVNAPGNQLGLYTTSTGFQYAYAAAGSGTIGNTLAHSDGVYPDDVYEGPWSQEGGQLKFEEKDFYACPFDSEAEPGTTPYRITGQGVGTPSIGQRCIDIAITLVPYTGLGAFQYD